MVEPGSIRIVQGTARPWLSGWSGWWRRELRDRYRRHRLRVHDVADLSEPSWRMRANQAAFFAPGHVQHIVRWEAAGVESPGAPTPPPGWRDFTRSWRIWPDLTHVKLEAHPTSVAVTRAGPTGWWEGAGRGLPLGAALLAAILLLLRAADRCLHTNFFKLPMRRRQSEEWPTPNVMATSLAVRMTSDLNSVSPPSPLIAQSNGQVDLPPPYSECADGTSTPTSPKSDHEEPPPPYSACYVAYSNPKDRPPSVHFFTRHSQNLFANYEAASTSVHDTGQEDDASHEEVRLTDEAGVIKNEEESENESCEMVCTDSAENDSEVELRETIALPRDSHLVV